MTSIIQGLNVSKCIYTYTYFNIHYINSLNDSLQSNLYCHIDTWFVTCSLWICHYELLYIYGINDVWILNLEILYKKDYELYCFDCRLLWHHYTIRMIHFANPVVGSLEIGDPHLVVTVSVNALAHGMPDHQHRDDKKWNMNLFNMCLANADFVKWSF